MMESRSGDEAWRSRFGAGTEAEWNEKIGRRCWSRCCSTHCAVGAVAFEELARRTSGRFTDLSRTWGTAWMIQDEGFRRKATRRGGDSSDSCNSAMSRFSVTAASGVCGDQTTCGRFSSSPLSSFANVNV